MCVWVGVASRKALGNEQGFDTARRGVVVQVECGEAERVEQTFSRHRCVARLVLFQLHDATFHVDGRLFDERALHVDVIVQNDRTFLCQNKCVNNKACTLVHTLSPYRSWRADKTYWSRLCQTFCSTPVSSNRN